MLGDMDPWLLPFKPPEDPDCYRKIVNDSYYKEAVKYMRQTLQSPPHVSLAALHPLVQVKPEITIFAYVAHNVIMFLP
jgi:hypothetical protein